LQAACGIDVENNQRSLRKAAKKPLYQQFVEKRIAELRGRIATGGIRE
jgi:hypothetical protein